MTNSMNGGKVYLLGQFIDDVDNMKTGYLCNQLCGMK